MPLRELTERRRQWTAPPTEEDEAVLEELENAEADKADRERKEQDYDI